MESEINTKSLLNSPQSSHSFYFTSVHTNLFTIYKYLFCINTTRYIDFDLFRLNSEDWTSSLDYSGWIDSLAYILAGAKCIVEKSLKVIAYNYIESNIDLERCKCIGSLQ